MGTVTARGCKTRTPRDSERRKNLAKISWRALKRGSFPRASNPRTGARAARRTRADAPLAPAFTRIVPGSTAVSARRMAYFGALWVQALFVGCGLLVIFIVRPALTTMAKCANRLDALFDAMRPEPRAPAGGDAGVEHHAARLQRAFGTLVRPAPAPRGGRPPRGPRGGPRGGPGAGAVVHYDCSSSVAPATEMASALAFINARRELRRPADDAPPPPIGPPKWKKRPRREPATPAANAAAQLKLAHLDDADQAAAATGAEPALVQRPSTSMPPPAKRRFRKRGDDADP
ncbi:hypothetical protein M885DRAFT_618857 [Pelagophyceae sp. CCMP2097]|nr:hypothetical protein M885DRAFT_618857 [Pelagophyceae sp. CCMP2097]